MSRKHALIVDDSQTAQARLQKMLQRYDLNVDTANSAEEALSYLSYRQPAVIFMDHLMKGLDGFEALKIIKSNPNTAMIPIVMYTSKKGDVYLGQARALGAIDVLSKDVIETSSLDRVMSSIHVLKRRIGSKSSINETGVAAADVEDSQSSSIKKQVAQLMAMHAAELKHEFSQGSRFLAKRLARETEELKKQSKKDLQLLHDEVQELHASDEESNAWLLRWRGLLVIVLCLLLFSMAGFYQLHMNQKQQKSINTHYETLSKTLERDYSKIKNDNKKLLKIFVGDKNQYDFDMLISTVEWALNTDNRFAYEQPALGDAMLSKLRDLVTRLDASGFSGKVLLDVHFGNFCVVANARGKMELPKGRSTGSNCQLLSSVTDSFPLEDQQSLAFIDFMISSAVLREGKISIEMQSHGLDVPRYQYPRSLTAKNVAQWNNVAKLNNRVHISIIP